MVTTIAPFADLERALSAAREARFELPVAVAGGPEQELRVARAALRQLTRARRAEEPDAVLAELREPCLAAWLFELVLTAAEPIAVEVTNEVRGAPTAETARYAARVFARRAATDPAIFALVANLEGPVARAKLRWLCEEGSAFCAPGPFARVALRQAERVARRSKFRSFQLDPEDIANGAMLAFARRRADDGFAPDLTADNRKEAERVFWAFCGLTALQLRARRLRAGRNLMFVGEFTNEAPAPGIPPEREEVRSRLTLNAALKVLSKTERAVLDAFRAGKSPALIAKERNSTVFAVQKHRSRAVAKIQRAALERVSPDAVIPAVWELVCAVRAEFAQIVALAQAVAQKPTAVEITREMLTAAQQRVAAARGLSFGYVEQKIAFACRTAFPGAPVEDFAGFDERG